MTGVDFLQVTQNAAITVLGQTFNELHLAISSENGVDPIVLDFSNGSRNVCQLQVEDPELSPLYDVDGPCLAVWTGEAQNDSTIHGIRFDGIVQLHVVGYLTQRNGAETSTREAPINAFLSAVARSFTDYVWPPVPSVASFVFSRKYRTSKRSLKPLNDGSRQIFEMVANVKVFVN